MDELEISGKRFISSKRAAKENRYHTDYIGQLIRSGKIVGSKVGRTWYVEAESLAAYLGKEYSASTPASTPAQAPAVFNEPIVTQKTKEPEQKIEIHRPKITYLSDENSIQEEVRAAGVSTHTKKEESHKPERPFEASPMSTTKVSRQSVVWAMAAVSLVAFGLAFGASYIVTYTNAVEGVQSTAGVILNTAQ